MNPCPIETQIKLGKIPPDMIPKIRNAIQRCHCRKTTVSPDKEPKVKPKPKGKKKGKPAEAVQ